MLVDEGGKIIVVGAKIHPWNLVSGKKPQLALECGSHRDRLLYAQVLDKRILKRGLQDKIRVSVN